jgi:hypothetical protein
MPDVELRQLPHYLVTLAEASHFVEAPHVSTSSDPR